MKNLIKFIPYVALVIICIMYMDSCNKRNNAEELYSQTQDTLKIFYDKDSLQTAQITVLETTSQKQFTELKSKDSTIQKLQSLVKKYKNVTSATILSNNTSGTISGSTVVMNKDTVTKDSIVYVYPEYSYSKSNKWENFKIKMNKDSTILDYKIFNDFELVQNLQKPKGLFHIFDSPTLESSVKNNNPNTVTTELRTFTVKCECNNSRFFIGGLAIGAGGTLLIQNLLSK